MTTLPRAGSFGAAVGRGAAAAKDAVNANADAPPSTARRLKVLTSPSLVLRQEASTPRTRARDVRCCPPRTRMPRWAGSLLRQIAAVHEGPVRPPRFEIESILGLPRFQPHAGGKRRFAR